MTHEVTATTLQYDLYGTPGLARAEGQTAHKVISTINDFPDYQQALTEDNSLLWQLMPVNLRQHLIIIKRDAQQAQIAFDVQQHAQLRPYLNTCKTHLLSNGLQLLNDLAVDSEVLQAVRRAISAKKLAYNSQAPLAGEDVYRFRSWVLDANEAGATDLHIRVLSGGRGEVLARIDGELEALPQTRHGVTDTDVLQAIRCAFESMADRHSNSTATFSEKTSMSCMIDTMLGIPELRLRFNSQRGLDGPKAVVRLLHEEPHKDAMPFADMGFETSQIELLHQAQRSESGIVLLCGVTGSGKTTVAKTFIETHPKNDGQYLPGGHHLPRAAFYQVADPIEYRLRGTHQIYVQRNLLTLSEAGKKDPYSEVMESLMRMDPDGIDCGEIRDVLSARAAMNIAKTGHLGLGTLHVSGISGIINRLTDPALGLTREELTADNALTLLVYQALVPLLCPHCKLPYDHAVRQHQQRQEHREHQHLVWLLQVLHTRFGVPPESLSFRNPEGCQSCRGRGTRGLTMVAEMMTPDDEWLDDARTGNDRQAWKNFRRRHSDRDLTSANMHGKTVLEHALYKTCRGLIDPRSIERFARSLDRYEVIA